MTGSNDSLVPAIFGLVALTAVAGGLWYCSHKSDDAADAKDKNAETVKEAPAVAAPVAYGAHRFTHRELTDHATRVGYMLPSEIPEGWRQSLSVELASVTCKESIKDPSIHWSDFCFKNYIKKVSDCEAAYASANSITPKSNYQKFRNTFGY